MKKIQPQKPSQVSPFAKACLDALVNAGLAKRISLGGGFGLFHYLDYRSTHDIDAWWLESPSPVDKKQITDILSAALSAFGGVNIRRWGDVISVELNQEGRVVFSFQIASRSGMLEAPIEAGWIAVSLDSLSDLTASKMTALVERGAPRDFLDIYQLCVTGLLTTKECWDLWHKRQTLFGNDADKVRARLAVETHLERIALQRPLGKIADASQKEQARRLREWFASVFLRDSNE